MSDPMSEGWNPEATWAWINLVQVSAIVEAALEEQLQGTAALSLAEHGLLLRIAVQPVRRVRMADLASLMLISRSGVTRIVDRLEEAGLVRRESDPSDRRATFAAVTDQGRTLALRTMPIFRQAMRERFAKFLDAEDVAALRRALRKVLEGNDAWDDARCSPTFPQAARTEVSS